jgi:hypothetical protein
MEVVTLKYLVASAVLAYVQVLPSVSLSNFFV